ncbi:hypothetical protein RhiJN_06378 [Ceratobasidium sp. AG-Ba]|nr:hypothetical protein RhiJN_06378 [Ceratobasidium sp. AG-Ba]
MHSFTAALALVLSSSALCVAAKELPGYSHLYSISAFVTENHILEGPLGSRFGLGVVSGNLTSPDGKVIATAVAGVGAETGFVDKNGIFQVQARSVWQFVDDKKYAYIESLGKGPVTGGIFSYQSFETDSPSRLAWNNQFIVSNISLIDLNHLFIDSFTFDKSS